ncbi:MAG: hypothetical protein QM756_24070 [Polyangiaceae bacterium]
MLAQALAAIGINSVPDSHAQRELWRSRQRATIEQQAEARISKVQAELADLRARSEQELARVDADADAHTLSLSAKLASALNTELDQAVKSWCLAPERKAVMRVMRVLRDWNARVCEAFGVGELSAYFICQSMALALIEGDGSELRCDHLGEGLMRCEWHGGHAASLLLKASIANKVANAEDALYALESFLLSNANANLGPVTEQTKALFDAHRSHVWPAARAAAITATGESHAAALRKAQEPIDAAERAEFLARRAKARSRQTHSFFAEPAPELPEPFGEPEPDPAA